ncbi:MAG TPA: DMT family transporter [Bauldia sp.]|nr:DMT family transporter [Bauldia sp.]
MSLLVLSALLAAAACHAAWNALVRRDGDRNAAALAVAAGSAAVGIALVPLLPGMSPAAVPFAFGSSMTHVLYYALVARAYRHGELSVVYPIMRGLAPLLVAVISVVFIEPAPAVVLAGIVVVAVGIGSLGVEGLRNGRAGIAAAVANAAVIAGYTIIDGLGARASGAPATYSAWIIFGGGVATILFNVAVGGRAVITRLRPRALLGLAGGVLSFGSYAIALWAMTFTPIGAVAAVRESSVLFATALGAFFLGERFGPWRWVAAALVVAGLAMVKLGGGAA